MPGTKICPRCKEEKQDTFEFFIKDRNHCRKCHVQATREWRRKNPDKNQELGKKAYWRVRNRAKFLTLVWDYLSAEERVCFEPASATSFTIRAQRNDIVQKLIAEGKFGEDDTAFLYSYIGD